MDSLLELIEYQRKECHGLVKTVKELEGLIEVLEKEIEILNSTRQTRRIESKTRPFRQKVDQNDDINLTGVIEAYDQVD